MFARPLVLAGLLLLAGGAAAAPADVPQEMNGMPLVFVDDFEQGTDRWEPTDPAAWKVGDGKDGKEYCLVAASNYEPAVRSPKSISWIKDLDVSDFVLDVQLKQTGKEYGHRDLCLFFGKQDPSHFYYVHLATTADEHANSIFLVNGEPRVSIAKERTDGTDWGANESYHSVRIVRDTAAGTIDVYFDDMSKPVMTTTDTTFTHGPIGLGSFDDVGCMDNVRVWGKEIKATEGAAK